MAPAPKQGPEEQLTMILEAAARCIEQTSLLDFTMSSISKEAGLSMGTIYKHIQSKEDVLLALATNMYRNLYRVFTEVMDLQLSCPLRLIAIQMFSFEKIGMFSFDDQLETLVASEAVLRRGSSRWVEEMRAADESLEKLCYDSIIKSVESGDLDTRGYDKAALVEEIMVGSWSMNVGFVQVARQRHCRGFEEGSFLMSFPLEISDSIVQAQKRLLNTYSWKKPVEDADIERACTLMEAKGLR